MFVCARAMASVEILRPGLHKIIHKFKHFKPACIDDTEWGSEDDYETDDADDCEDEYSVYSDEYYSQEEYSDEDDYDDNIDDETCNDICLVRTSRKRSTRHHAQSPQNKRRRNF